MNGRCRNVVCTTLVGGYETLTEQPVADESGFEFVCFTDDAELSSETWQIHRIVPHLPMDLIRSVRHVKILLDDYLPGLDQTLWIDNSVTLLSPPERFFAEWLQDADVAVPLHSFRTTLMDEFNAVAAHALDDTSRIYEQLVHYAATDPLALEQQPHWCGIVARRHNEKTAALMRLWYDHLLRFSRRDQLSFPYVARHTDAHVASVAIDNAASAHHRWPTAANRVDDDVRRRFSAAFIPEIARLGDAEKRTRELEAIEARERARAGALEEERTELLAAMAHLEESLAQSVGRAAGMERTLEDVRVELEETRASFCETREVLDLVLASISWRIGRPLRWASGKMRRVIPGGA